MCDPGDPRECIFASRKASYTKVPTGPRARNEVTAACNPITLSAPAHELDQARPGEQGENRQEVAEQRGAGSEDQEGSGASRRAGGRVAVLGNQLGCCRRGWDDGIQFVASPAVSRTSRSRWVVLQRSAAERGSVRSRVWSRAEWQRVAGVPTTEPAGGPRSPVIPLDPDAREILPSPEVGMPARARHSLPAEGARRPARQPPALGSLVHIGSGRGGCARGPGRLDWTRQLFANAAILACPA